MKKKLAIIGAGGLSKEIICLIDDLGLYHKIDGLFIDDLFYDSLIYREVMGISIKRISEVSGKKHEGIIAIGEPKHKKAFVNKLPQLNYPTFIHPSSKVSRWVQIENGCLLMANSILTSNVHLKDFCLIDRMANIGHDCSIGKFCQIAPGAIISGSVIVGDNCYLGAMVSVKEKISISSNVAIEIGSVVVNEIESSGIYAGNPAKKLKDIS